MGANIETEQQKKTCLSERDTSIKLMELIVQYGILRDHKIIYIITGIVRGSEN